MSNANTYIGVDLHKKTCYITVMNKKGKIRKQTEISTDTIKSLNSLKNILTLKWRLNQP